MCQRIGLPADLDHRLRDAAGLLAHPDAVAAAEEDDLHSTTPAGSSTWAVGIGTISCAPHSLVYASWSAISRARFHGRITIASGRVSAIRSGGSIGMCVPGVNRPCLYGFRSTV